MSPADSHRRYPVTETAEVSQYGVDYIELRTQEGVGLTLNFRGVTETPLVAGEVSDGRMWWSNRGDQSNTTLTRPVDLQCDRAEAHLPDVVRHRRRVGLCPTWRRPRMAARHGKILEGRTTTDDNPVGNAYGVGWTGASGEGGAGGIDEKWN